MIEHFVFNGMSAPRILGVLRKDAIPYGFYDKKNCGKSVPQICRHKLPCQQNLFLKIKIYRNYAEVCSL